jgi:teichoic acid transport system ATP-binding protein
LPSDSDIVIAAEDLQVTYRANIDRAPTLKSLALRRERGARLREIEALRGVSLEISRGSVLGVIGSNGAGKTTLMRTIAGIIPPTAGKVTVRGDVTAILSMGVGFRTDLSGRDNIRLGGLASGLSQEEIDATTEDVIDFAELSDFIDLPVRTYSSGMRGRLAFSVATQASPDILLVDEALSAGDARFKRRASERIEQLCASSSTVVLVSHGLASVTSMCDRAVWLDKGIIREVGSPQDVVAVYTESIGESASAPTSREDL